MLLQLDPLFLPFPTSTQPLLCSFFRPSQHCCSCPWFMHICSLANSFPFFYQVPSSLLPSDSCQSVPCVHDSVSILFVSLFYSLDSTYKRNHMVLSFTDWLISLSITISRSNHGCVNVPQLFYPPIY